MSLPSSIRHTLRSSTAPLFANRTLTTTSRLAAKSPLGEAISQIAQAEGGTEKGSQSAKLQSEVTRALNDRDAGLEGRSSTAKSPAGEAISQVAKAEGGTEKDSKSAAMQSEVTKMLNDQNAGGGGREGSGGAGANAQRQSQVDREANFAQVADEVGEKLARDPGSVSAEDAAKVQSREHRAHGKVSRDGVSAEAQRVADGS